MSAALASAGGSLAAHDSLLSLLHSDLVRAMFAAARQPNVACLVGVCQVALGLYVHLGTCMLPQVEALLALLLLPMAEGKGSGGAGGVTPEQQQAALEGVLDFCSHPGFVRDIYVNADCRLERADLFESICALLSKAAFPVNAGPLGAPHLLSLDGILAILASLAAGSDPGDADSTAEPRDPGHLAPPPEPEHFVDIWGPLAAGQRPPVREVVGGSVGGDDSVAELARVEKHLKGRLAAAAEHFNRDQKKGLQYLQVSRAAARG